MNRATLASWWPALAFLAAALMLASAHAFERFGGLQPCTLCLRQREVYWTVLAVSAAGLVLSRLRPRLSWLVSALLVVLFLVSAGVALYHAGAEQKWWPGPSTCSSGGLGGLSTGDLMLVPGARIEGPACDKIVWSLFGLSMAGWNVLISLALAALSLGAALTARRR